MRKMVVQCWSDSSEWWQPAGRALAGDSPCVCFDIRTFSPTNNVASLWASVSEPWAPGSGQRYSAQLFLVGRACMVCSLAPQSVFSALFSQCLHCSSFPILAALELLSSRLPGPLYLLPGLAEVLACPGPCLRAGHLLPPRSWNSQLTAQDLGSSVSTSGTVGHEVGFGQADRVTSGQAGCRAGWPPTAGGSAVKLCY